MASRLPPLALDELAARLGALAPVPAPGVVAALLEHYDELRRWAGRVSLIGPGTASAAIERHYAQSLAGSPLIPSGRMLDIGSGAGFPGLVLAAARPDVEVVLLERRLRKAAFLRSAARRMGVRVEVLEGDLRTVLPRTRPEALDSVTLRAVGLVDQEWQVVLDHTNRQAVFVLWQGRETPDLPPGFREEMAVELAGRQTRVVRYRWRQPR